MLEGTVFVAEEGRVYKLTSGDLIFHKPLEFHKIWCNDAPHAKFQVISFEATNNDIAPLGNNVYRLALDSSAALDDVYKTITDAFAVNINVERREPTAQNLINEKIAYLKLELFLLTLLPKQNNSEARQHTTGANNFKLIMDTLQAHLNYNLNIEEIAALCNMSTSNLKKTFNKFCDGGIMHHFLRMKIQRASIFLKEGRSVEELAFNYGFKSASHFSTAFKRITGMTPTEFKKRT